MLLCVKLVIYKLVKEEKKYLYEKQNKNLQVLQDSFFKNGL